MNRVSANSLDAAGHTGVLLSQWRAYRWPRPVVSRTRARSLLAVTGLTSVITSFRWWLLHAKPQNGRWPPGPDRNDSYSLSMLVASFGYARANRLALVAATLLAGCIQVILSHWLLPSFVHGFRWRPQQPRRLPSSDADLHQHVLHFLADRPIACCSGFSIRWRRWEFTISLPCSLPCGFSHGLPRKSGSASLLQQTQ